MKLIPLKSERLLPKSDLLSELKNALQKANERLNSGDVLVIASKAISYAEDRLKKVKNGREFRDLIRRESDQVFDDSEMTMTIKNNVLIPNAGIDNSNTPNGQVILWPKDAFMSAANLRKALKTDFDIKDFGIVVSDSRCQPLRWGTTGIAIGWAGIKGIRDERGNKDLFDRELTYTQIAVADDLASAANLLMGEGSASIPFVIIRDAPVTFTEKPASKNDYAVPMSECIYRSIYRKDLCS